MKVKLDQITVTQVEHELPEKCPKCKTDFTDEEELGLVEIQFVSGEQRCGIIEGRIDNYGEIEDETEAKFAQGYKCASCDEILVLLKENVEIGEVHKKESSEQKGAE